MRDGSDGATGPAGTQGATGTNTPTAAKHVILVIADGMNVSHEVAASRYLTGKDFGLSFQQFPYRTNCTTWDVTSYDTYASKLNSDAAFSEDIFFIRDGYDQTKGGSTPSLKPVGGDPVADNYFMLPATGTSIPAWPATDSASAISALLNGRKTDGGKLNWKSNDVANAFPNQPGSTTLATIAEMARTQLGARIGLVSTVPFTHATPAGVIAHTPDRNAYKAATSKSGSALPIDQQIVQAAPDVVIGGGHPAYDTTYTTTATLDQIRAATSGYVYAERTTGVAAGPALLAAADSAVTAGKKLFAVYGGPGGNFPPYTVSATGAPTVTQSSNESPTLADCADAALRVLRGSDGGKTPFFVMIEQGDIDWSNHANDFRTMVGGVYDLDQTIRRIQSFVDQSGDDITWDNTLLIVTSDHSNSYMRIITNLGKGVLPTQNGTADAGGIYPVTGTSFTYPNGEITYSSTGHTNELVNFYATGAGLDRFRGFEGLWNGNTRLIDNTLVFFAMCQAMGIKPGYDPLIPATKVSN